MSPFRVESEFGRATFEGSVSYRWATGQRPPTEFDELDRAGRKGEPVYLSGGAVPRGFYRVEAVNWSPRYDAGYVEATVSLRAAPDEPPGKVAGARAGVTPKRLEPALVIYEELLARARKGDFVAARALSEAGRLVIETLETTTAAGDARTLAVWATNVAPALLEAGLLRPEDPAWQAAFRIVNRPKP